MLNSEDTRSERRRSPARLPHAGYLTLQRQRSKAHSAQRELPIVAPPPPAQLTPVVTASGELWSSLLFNAPGSLRHFNTSEKSRNRGPSQTSFLSAHVKKPPPSPPLGGNEGGGIHRLNGKPNISRSASDSSELDRSIVNVTSRPCMNSTSSTLISGNTSCSTMPSE